MRKPSHNNIAAALLVGLRRRLHPVDPDRWQRRTGRRINLMDRRPGGLTGARRGKA
jgi:hypothetical protein